MVPALFLPLLAALVAACFARTLHGPLGPRLAARVLAIVAVGTALAVLWGAGILAIGFLVEIPWITASAGWCRALYRADDRVVPLLGLMGLAVVAAAIGRGGRAAYRHRRVVRGSTPGGPLEIISSRTPIAFAMPGRPGHIVVSTAMLDELDVDEQRVLLAHEQSHLDHRHDRYLMAAEVAVAAVPLLRPVAAGVRFSTERWADEDAATAVGDRRLVARSIARAALVTADHSSRRLGLASLGVPARIEALLVTSGRRPAAPALALAVGGGLTVFNLAGATVQLHHLVTFTAHICNLA